MSLEEKIAWNSKGYGSLELSQLIYLSIDQSMCVCVCVYVYTHIEVH